MYGVRAMAELSYMQREILQTLINLYIKSQRLVKSTEIAKVLNRDDGTIRNVILGLRSLGLVESKTGPNGGYKPTPKAFSYLKLIYEDLGSFTKIRRDGVEINVHVLNVELIDLTNPYSSKAILKISGDINILKVGDRISVGPLPTSRLVLSGIILLIDMFRSELVVEIESLVSIPKEPVKSLLRARRLITIGANSSIRDVAKILASEGIRGVPVIDDSGKLLGIVTSADVIRALVNNDVDAPLTKYIRSVVTVGPDEDLYSVIDKMVKQNTGRVVVVYDGKPIGIVTRTDILNRLAGLSS